MSNFGKLSSIILCVFAFCSVANSQFPNDSVRQQEQVIKERDLERRIGNLDMVARDGLRSHQEALIRRRQPKTPPETKEQRAAIKKALSPNAEDSEKYKTFLQQSNTGLFRLFPDFGCEDEKLTIRVDGNCVNQIPGTWFYSFRRKGYSEGLRFRDLHFIDGNLVSRGILLQGILVNLGDVPLETVLPSSGGVKFLLDFKPGSQSEEAKKQYAEFNKGIETGGYRYANSLKADENKTYALRVIAYRSKVDQSEAWEQPTADKFRFYANALDGKRIDLTVAFRIIRKDEDGNITILWKEINRGESPKFDFGKIEKSSDKKTDE